MPDRFLVASILLTFPHFEHDTHFLHFNVLTLSMTLTSYILMFCFAESHAEWILSDFLTFTLNIASIFIH